LIQSQFETNYQKPKWEPVIPISIHKTAQIFARHTDQKRTFAVFAHGTCVVLPNGCHRKEVEAKAILDQVVHYPSDFKTEVMRDGNFLVEYSQPAYSIVLNAEVKLHREYIEFYYRDGLLRSEIPLNPNSEKTQSQISDLEKIGLLARARMFMDAQNPVLVTLWEPQSVLKPSGQMIFEELKKKLDVLA
jgi:hypothetical protein